MYTLIVIASIFINGQEHHISRTEIKARSREDCIEALEHAVKRPYVTYAMCEKV
jgi:hypothetical protein